MTTDVCVATSDISRITTAQSPGSAHTSTGDLTLRNTCHIGASCRGSPCPCMACSGIACWDRITETARPAMTGQHDIASAGQHGKRPRCAVHSARAEVMSSSSSCGCSCCSCCSSAAPPDAEPILPLDIWASIRAAGVYWSHGSSRSASLEKAMSFADHWDLFEASALLPPVRRYSISYAPGPCGQQHSRPM